MKQLNLNIEYLFDDIENILSKLLGCDSGIVVLVF
jgi:hypothetical protein